MAGLEVGAFMCVGFLVNRWRSKETGAIVGWPMQKQNQYIFVSSIERIDE
jgi:hypothetical protein